MKKNKTHSPLSVSKERLEKNVEKLKKIITKKAKLTLPGVIYADQELLNVIRNGHKLQTNYAESQRFYLDQKLQLVKELEAHTAAVKTILNNYNGRRTEHEMALAQYKYTLQAVINLLMDTIARLKATAILASYEEFKKHPNVNQYYFSQSSESEVLAALEEETLSPEKFNFLLNEYHYLAETCQTLCREIKSNLDALNSNSHSLTKKLKEKTKVATINVEPGSHEYDQSKKEVISATVEEKSELPKRRAKKESSGCCCFPFFKHSAKAYADEDNAGLLTTPNVEESSLPEADTGGLLPDINFNFDLS